MEVRATLREVAAQAGEGDRGKGAGRKVGPLRQAAVTQLGRPA